MTVAVLYEHPEWFRPLFATFDRRGIDYVEIDAAALSWRPAHRPAFDLLVNRMSPSAYLRGHAHAVHAALHYVAYVESWGIPVVNGTAAYSLEISKATQLRLLDRLGLRYPASRVINHAGRALEAAEGLRFPLVVKPNIGGSGARIQRFDSRDALAQAVDAGTIDLGIDHTALVQEFLPARGGSITRVELLDGEQLYAIRITPPSGFGFNLCPADICRDGDATPAATTAEVEGLCPTKPAMDIVATEVPAAVAEATRTIARTAGLDVCGIEFLIDDRDGQACYYDINALSNFVTDAPRIVGFDPFERFVDYLERRAARGAVRQNARPETAEAIFAS
jgi:glutathione synthase/RimK-type ligase-like ATP-grasp enzyme